MIDMQDLGEVVECFAEDEDLVVRRPGAIAVVNGRRRAGADSPVLGVIGSTWPVTGERRGEYTEGGRIREARDVFTTPASARLVLHDDPTQGSSDIIEIEGKDYEVIEVHAYSRGNYGHYIAALIKRTGGV